MLDRHIDVSLGDHSYPLYIGTDCLSEFAPTCRRHNIPDTIVLITDRTVARYHLRELLQSLKRNGFLVTTIVIEPGEARKSLPRANAIYTEMLEKRIPRNSAIIALGGGVIGDLAGFIAATYQRGVELIQMPTTLLAQVDSSIGGKVAVNHPLGKNMIGSFYQPEFVWMDAGYLRTLEGREILCGLGEVVKYGIIRDPELFSLLESKIENAAALENDVLTRIITTCAALKGRIVSEDEKERGVRVILNCGHTVGHGLEAAGHYRVLKHGEAVLLGLAAESLIANKLGLLDGNSCYRILSLVRRLPVQKRLSLLRMSAIVQAMKRDKKRIGAGIRFVLPLKIGAVKVVDNVDIRLARSAIREVLRANHH
jgi:3-dehydroquinate synthase